jgi:hypothetical protein
MVNPCQKMRYDPSWDAQSPLNGLSICWHLGNNVGGSKNFEDHLNVYRQQWQADQQKQIISQMAGKNPHKSNDNKGKNSDIIHHNSNGGRSSTRYRNNNRGGRGERGRGRGGRGGRTNNNEHLKVIECFNCGRKCHYSTDCSQPRKNDNKNSNMVSKADFKNLFQSSLKDMLSKKKEKNNAEGDDDSLDMKVFQKIMEGKQQMFVNENNMT